MVYQVHTHREAYPGGIYRDTYTQGGIPGWYIPGYTHQGGIPGWYIQGYTHPGRHTRVVYTSLLRLSGASYGGFFSLLRLSGASYGGLPRLKGSQEPLMVGFRLKRFPGASL